MSPVSIFMTCVPSRNTKQECVCVCVCVLEFHQMLKKAVFNHSINLNISMSNVDTFHVSSSKTLSNVLICF